MSDKENLSDVENQLPELPSLDGENGESQDAKKEAKPEEKPAEEKPKGKPGRKPKGDPAALVFLSSGKHGFSDGRKKPFKKGEPVDGIGLSAKELERAVKQGVVGEPKKAVPPKRRNHL